MKEAKPICLAFAAATLMFSIAEAQVTIDVSKITCGQYTSNQVSDLRSVSIWLSGFYAGRRNNPIIETKALEDLADRLTQYCSSHRDMKLMQAVEALRK